MRVAVTTTETATTITLKDKPCLGPYAEKSLLSIGGIVSLTWEGKVSKVFPVKSLEALHDSWFEPNDKGTAAFVAYNTKGDPIYAACLYKGSVNAETEEEKGPHYWFDHPEKFCY